MPTIKPFPTTVEHQRRLQALAERRSAQRISDIEHGKKAWSEFQGARREELDFEERKTIARNLWLEIEKYRGGKDGTLTQLLEKTGIELKHIGRVILAPDKSGNNELHPSPPKYIALMEALIRRTNEDIYLLADRVLLGTHFHPESLADLQDAQLILEALQVAVDQIDQEFKLWEQCQAIAEIRAPLEKHYIEAVRRGDFDTAYNDLLPDIGDDSIPRQAIEDVQRWWPLEPNLLMFNILPGQNIEQRPIAPTNSFWLGKKPSVYSFATSVWSGESILFFPHIYLGQAIEWPNTRPENYKDDALWIDIDREPYPVVRFESGMYQVYLVDPVTGTEGHGGSEFDWGMRYEMCVATRWLMMYPDPEANRLVPTLFTLGGFMDSEMTPLTARLIADFGNKNHWDYLSSSGSISLLQRLRELTGYGIGDFKTFEAWHETASRFHLNPIFKSHPGEAENILYRRHLEKWIKDGRASMQRTSEVDE